MLNTIKKYFGLAAILSGSTITLFACGGGSSSAPTLNLFVAYKAFATEGYFLPGVISGYCEGTRAQTFQPGALGVNPNDSAPAFIQNVSEIDVLAPAQSPAQQAFCGGFYSNPAFSIYFDPVAFTPQSDLSGSGYVYSNQVAFPTSVTAGSKGTYYTSQKFNTTVPNNPVLTLNTVNTWEVKADTATTLLYITTNTGTTPTGQLLFKSITTYRLNANNTLTDLRKNIQISNLSTGGNGDQNIYETY
jgi:hypothetical protein